MVRKRPLPGHTLLDQIKAEFNLPSDAELARLLGVMAPVLSKLRYNTNAVTAEFILKVYDATQWPIEKIRSFTPDANAREQSKDFGYEDS